MAYGSYGGTPADGGSRRTDLPQASLQETPYSRDNNDPSTQPGPQQHVPSSTQPVYTPYHLAHDPASQPYHLEQPLDATSWGAAAGGGLPALPLGQQYGLPPDTGYQQHQFYQPPPPEHPDSILYQPPPQLPIPPFLSAPDQALNLSSDLFTTTALAHSPSKSAPALPFQRGSLSSGAGASDGDGEESGGSGGGPGFIPVYSVQTALEVTEESASGFGPMRTATSGAAGRGAGGTAATMAAAETGRGSAAVKGVGGPSPAVAALAAGVGPRTTEKSCKNCRLRKVKCDRQWPRCNRCKQRNEDCSFGTFVPVDVIPASALQTAVASSGAAGLQTSAEQRNAELEERIRSLEAELSAVRSTQPAQPLEQLTNLPSAHGTEPGSVLSQGSSRSAPGPLVTSRQPAAFPTVEGFNTAFVSGGGEGGGDEEEDTAVSRSSLSETIRSVFSAGAGLGRPGAPGQQTVESFLRGVAQSQPDYYARFAPTLVGGSPGAAMSGESAFGGPGAAGGFDAPGLVPNLSEGSAEWKMARKEMGRVLVIHLVQSFFASCCAYLPSFHGWDNRRPWILANIDNLDPASRVAVAAFCAMGARASPHSALLGIPLSSPSPEDSFAQASAAGVRREQACRALHTQAMDFMHLLGITFDATKENLEAIMVMAQMLIFNELVPRRSRSMVHAALGHFKELQQSALPPTTKDDLLHHIGLPLLTCDAVTSAYARKKPLITEHDLETYFPSFVAANFEKENIQTTLQDCLRQHATADGLLSHEGIGRAAAVVHSWIAQCQRLFAKAAAPIAGGPPSTLHTQIKNLWRLLDEIHEGIRKLQEMLVHLSYVPHGCASDGCADQHLRFVTRLDKDLIDVFFLIHTLVSENLGLDSLVGQEGQQAYSESDRRIRKALKLVAFYSELYITSRDPHMTYHVVWQLEVLPNWTAIAVQRHGEPGGPATPDLEVSDTELDWFVKGLIAASFYHPVAISRLQELQHSRRPSYQNYSPSAQAGPANVQAGATAGSAGPPLTPFGGGASHGSSASGSYRPPSHHQQQLHHHHSTTTTTQQYFSSTAAGETREGQEVNLGERVPAEDPSFTFQGGHTEASANKEWGQWDGPGPS
ncbi:hypothetical protein JCM6882_001286 [Rhodosporidiobolus microsporus]